MPLTTNVIIEHWLFFGQNKIFINFEVMVRLSIEFTEEQHQLLKVAATMKGESIKEYVLKRTLPNIDSQEGIEKLESFLRPRINAAQNEAYSKKSVDEIFDGVLEVDN